ncbi:MAG TPA: helix-turn-helix domain-containing protein [Psychromonas sp.]
MDKRTTILQTAEKLLAERGFYGLSMKALADNAGVAAGTIYRYFENKEEMINQLHQYVKKEAAITMFNGLDEQLTEKEKYSLIWRNTFHSVLKNPQRMLAISMLCLRPCIEGHEMFSSEDQTFAPLFNLYNRGVREHRFIDLPVEALVSLSFESAVNLAKKALHINFIANEQLIEQVINVSWQAILKPTN